MSRSDRGTTFSAASKTDPLCAEGDWKSSDCYGVSNRAHIIRGGLLAGVCNLSNASRSLDGFIFNCLHAFPGGTEVYFAVLVGSDASLLVQRLEEMEATKNNNVRLYLADDGRLYLHNSGYIEEVDAEFRAGAQPAVGVDMIDCALAVGDAGSDSPGALEFMDYLSRLATEERFRRIDPWEGTDGAGQPGGDEGNPAHLDLNDLVSRIRELGGFYPDRLVRRLHMGLNHLRGKHFVILTGLSGTGKTDLIRKYAQAVHGISDPTTADPLFFLCAVRPDWTDPSGLTGYHDVISRRYVVPAFLKAVLAARRHPAASVFVCLDEMNLAHVEHYFADVLSAMETGLPLEIHAHDMPLEGTSGGRIPPSLSIPDNLFLAGTVNVDETTSPISDKVLDRAVVIDTSDVDLKGFLDALAEREPVLRTSIEQCAPLLVDLEEILLPHGNGFGYRVAEEFVRYHHFAASLDRDVDGREMVDEQIRQKILTRLRGTERERKMLAAVAARLVEYPMSSSVVAGLQSDLDEFGSFQAVR